MKTIDNKSNKSDLKCSMQSIDIMHKQIKSMIALLAEHVLQTNKNDLFEHVMQISKWVNLFNPENINNDHLLMPSYLTKYVTK